MVPIVGFTPLNRYESRLSSQLKTPRRARCSSRRDGRAPLLPGSTSYGRFASRGCRTRTRRGGRRCLGVPVHLLARAKCSRVLENRGRALKSFDGFRPIAPVERAAHHKLWLSLAVIQSLRWTLAHTNDLGRTRTDTPPTVLKTAGPASANVRQRASEIGTRLPHSTFVRRRPPRFVMLAVILAVRTTAGFGRTVPNRVDAVSSGVRQTPAASSRVRNRPGWCPLVTP
jgi:hypothetical protein